MNHVLIVLMVWMLVSGPRDRVDAQCCDFKMQNCPTKMCNIFCCDCEGGCMTLRKHSREKRFIPSILGNDGSFEARNRFKMIDADGNNGITKTEADTYLRNQVKDKENVATKYSLEEEMTKMDANMDGMISPGEFDFSLK